MLQTANFFLVISFLMRMTLAITFLTSGLPKLRQPYAFASAVTAYRLLPKPWIRPVATILPWLELCLGLLLLLGWGTKITAGISAGLLFLFLCAMGINIARGGKDLDCGCTGKRHAQKIGWKTILRNAGLILFSVTLVVSRGGYLALDHQPLTVRLFVLETLLLHSLLPLTLSLAGVWLLARILQQIVRLVLLVPIEKPASEGPGDLWGRTITQAEVTR